MIQPTNDPPQIQPEASAIPHNTSSSSIALYDKLQCFVRFWRVTVPLPTRYKTKTSVLFIPDRPPSQSPSPYIEDFMLIKKLDIL